MVKKSSRRIKSVLSQRYGLGNKVDKKYRGALFSEAAQRRHCSLQLAILRRSGWLVWSDLEERP